MPSPRGLVTHSFARPASTSAPTSPPASSAPTEGKAGGPAAPPPTILSGIQSSGIPTLGNYLGALKNWARLQHEQPDATILYAIMSTSSSLFIYYTPPPTVPLVLSSLISFCSPSPLPPADLHSITMPQDPAELRANTRTTAIALLACGIDPERSVLFQQSHVPAHLELAWVLSCITPMGLLRRQTQFKTKGSDAHKASLGLFSYPVLMAADILAYRATHVPVGDDQLQHLELARDVATAFNQRFPAPAGSAPYFPPPQALLSPAPRIMSLRMPTNKMSKSDASDLSRININDPPNLIRKKIRKAVTDSTSQITYCPEVCAWGGVGGGGGVES